MPATQQREPAEAQQCQSAHRERQALGQRGNGSADDGMVPPNGSKFVCSLPPMEAAKMLPSNWPLLASVTA